MADVMPNNRRSSHIRGKIKVNKNRPYVVSGGIPLSTQIIGNDAAGYSFEWRKVRNIHPMRTALFAGVAKAPTILSATAAIANSPNYGFEL